MFRNLSITFTILFVLAVSLRADPPGFVAQESGIRSLQETVRKLLPKTGWLICVEEPVWPQVSRAGPMAQRSFLGDIVEPPQPDQLEVAVERIRGRAGGLDMEAGKTIVAAYNRQNPGMAAYRAERFGHYVALLPDAQHLPRNARPSVLSLEISVPVARRWLAEHAEELAKALSSAAGVPVGIDAAVLSYRMHESSAGTDAGKFEWGAANTTGRLALIDLLLKSQTTIVWQLNCQAGVGNAPGHCGLSLIPRVVEIRDRQGRTTRRGLFRDRGPNPEIPPPPPPPND